MLGTALGRHQRRRQVGVRLDDAGAVRFALQVVRAVSEQRSTWTRWNIYAETERVVGFPTPADREAATGAVVAAATGRGCRSGSPSRN